MIVHHGRVHAPRREEGMSECMPAGMPSWMRRVREALGSERGESSIFLVMLVPIIFAVGVGLTFDWAGKVRATEEAVVLAQQAARAGVNAGLYGDSGAGTAAQLDRGQATRATQAFLAQAGASGVVTTTNEKVRVEVTVDYEPRFIPTGTLHGRGTGEASARPNEGGGRP